MLEAKAKDLSLLKLKADLLRYAPDVAARFGTGPDDASEAAEVEAMLDEGLEEEA
jgi:UV DNA damage endonuclease